MQNLDSKRQFKQKRNLIWTVRNLSVFTALPAHVHCEEHIMQNKWCCKRPYSVDLGGVTIYVYTYISPCIYICSFINSFTDSLILIDLQYGSKEAASTFAKIHITANSPLRKSSCECMSCCRSFCKRKAHDPVQGINHIMSSRNLLCHHTSPNHCKHLSHIGPMTFNIDNI